MYIDFRFAKPFKRHMKYQKTLKMFEKFYKIKILNFE